MRESPGHLAIAVAFGNFHILIERFEGRGISLLAKNAPTFRKMLA